MLPWLMERGEVPLAEVAERFRLTEDEVAADLELVAMCGLPPFVDELIDVFIDEGTVFVGVPRLFTRPLRLNSIEAFELLAAGRAAMELPGADASGPLGRGLAKLAAALGGDDTRRCWARRGARRRPRATRRRRPGRRRGAPARTAAHHVLERVPRRLDGTRDHPTSGVRRPRQLVCHRHRPPHRRRCARSGSTASRRSSRPVRSASRPTNHSRSRDAGSSTVGCHA